MHRLRPIAGEDGAVAVVVALLLTVMLGMGAFVIDVGALYQEKRELQNGSDAGALAVGEDCATGDCGPYTATAESLADPNAEDDATTVDGVTIDTAAQTVKVDTSTSDPGGGSVIAYKFAQVLGLSGDTVRASATAQWSPPSRAPSVPLVISKCEWDRSAGSPDALPTGTLTVTFHSGGSTEPCNGPAGQDVPGGFGWLDATDCLSDLSVADGGVWAESKPGNTPTGTGCSPSNFALGSTVLVPVFDDTTGQGTNAKFHIVGFAAFEIVGTGLHNSGGWTDGEACDLTLSDDGGNPGNGGAGNSTQCITGRFVKFFAADAAAGGLDLPDLGVTTVSLIK